MKIFILTLIFSVSLHTLFSQSLYKIGETVKARKTDYVVKTGYWKG